jgi:hypothetical protein
MAVATCSMISLLFGIIIGLGVADRVNLPM